MNTTEEKNAPTLPGQLGNARARKGTSAFSRNQLSHVTGTPPVDRNHNNKNFSSAKPSDNSAKYADEDQLRKPN